MPTLEALEYDHFRMDASDQPMSLDDAVRKAEELRAADRKRENFYRIEAANESSTEFRVKTVPASTVYSEFYGRISQKLARFLSRVGR